MPALRLAPAVVTLVLGATALTGCSTTIDDGKAEDLIQKSVTEQTGAKVKSVDCPSDQSAKAGGKFDCKVTASDNTTGTAVVTMKDDKGNVATDAPFLHIREAEAKIAQSVEDNNDASGVKVACDEIVTAKKGNTFKCKATAGSDKVDLVVTLTDDNGNFTYKSS